ncbi:MAG: glycoside hydrolase family 3 protein, partial [Alphaproteobacteria bacterium]|nr:glycoside hydrolase family 3 protein [Alphaproteobacteria bacterium]
VVYTALDPDAPATMSRTVIEEVIRGEIGFDGELVSDDLSMKALSGDFAERTRRALAAGCDLVLHCNGRMDEMTAVLNAAAPPTDAALDRLARAASRKGRPAGFDAHAALARLGSLLA